MSCLEKAKGLAEQRLAAMDHLLEWFVADSAGFF
jgi:hypothetical protein